MFKNIKFDIVKTSKTEGTKAIVESSWQLPAISTQLHKINQGDAFNSVELVDSQIVGLRGAAGIELYKVDFVSKHRPEHDMSDRIDMLVVSHLIKKETRTLTYWTDFETEILLPKAPASSKLFLDDLLKPKVVVVGGDSVLPSEVAAAASVSHAAKHSWPAVKKGQEDLVRMEATEGGEWKFWSIWKSGPRVFYHHGRIGEPQGNEGSYVISSIRQAGGAVPFMQKKIAEKVKKGYVKV